MVIFIIVNSLLIVKYVLKNVKSISLYFVKKGDRTIGACNNCSKLRSCTLDKYFYKADIAQKNYKYTLSDARQGVNLNTSELIELAHIICPLIKKGQSIYTILTNHPEITFCEKTIYNYIEMGLFKDWDITNLTLKRKVRRKISKKKLKSEKNLKIILVEHTQIILNTKF